MTTATQQISSNPARDFANGILAETNNGLELIDILRDIAEGSDEDATTNDRIAANNILLDRALGKCPKQPPAASPYPEHAPATGDNDIGAIRESPHTEPASPRLVTQIDESLNQSLGPAPSAHTPVSQSPDLPHSAEDDSPESPAPFDPFSIQAIIQRHILAITNNGQTLRDALLEIARAKDDPKVKTSHHRRAARILIDRLAGTDLMPAHSAVCPECRRKWTAHPGSHAHPESHPGKAPGPRMSKADPEALAEARAEIQRMKDEGILTPDPNAKKIDITPYLPPDDFDLSPYAKEEAAKFWANIELRYERQQQWPAIEERRRKKLAQIYPSHSDDSDSDPPDQ